MKWRLIDYPRSRGITASLLSALACHFLHFSAFSATTGTWVSDSTGQSIAAPTVDYSANLPFQGTASASFTGLDFGLDVGHLEFDTGLITPPSSIPVNWSNPFVWDNPVVGYAWYGSVTSIAQGGTISSYNTSTGVTYDVLNTFNDLIDGGPTEGTISISAPIPDFPFISLSIGTTVKFDVHIDSGQIVNVDQNATIESFTVLPGATVDIQSGNTLTVNSSFSNTGTIEIESGGIFTRASSTMNAGSMTLNGGSLNVAGGFTNIGTFNWFSGSLGYQFVNSATMTVCGGTDKGIAEGGVLTNNGVLTHTGTGSLVFNGYPTYWGGLASTFNNMSGALYDLQSDAGFVGAQNFGFDYFNNAGTFRKSAGTGTSTFDGNVAFNNTGTVEVDSGTLEFDGGGFSNGGGFVFNNGGSTRIAGGTFTFSATNTGTGIGILELAAGANVTGSNAATLNFISGSQVNFTGGTLKGPIANTGNFVWTGGTMGAFTNSSATMTLSGGADKGIAEGGVLTNNGVLTHTGTGSLVFNGYPTYWGGLASTFNNTSGALYDLQSDAGFVGAQNFGFDYFNNAGTFRKSAGTGTSTFDANIAFNNTGTVEVDSGTLQFDGGGSSNGGGFVFTNGGLARIAGGSFTFSATNTGTGTGILELATGANVMGSNAATLNFVSGSQVNFTGGTLNGPIANTGNFVWTGGTMGTFTNSSATMTMGGSTDKSIAEGGVLTNNGFLTHTGTGSLVFNGYPTYWGELASTFNNTSGALYDLQSDAGFVGAQNFGFDYFNNAGTFRKSAGTGTSTFDANVAFNNTGTVEVDSGTLQFDGGGSSNGGGFVFTNGGLARIAGGTFTFSATNTGTGIGILELAAGANVMGSNAATLNFVSGSQVNFTGGTLNGPIARACHAL